METPLAPHQSSLTHEDSNPKILCNNTSLNYGPPSQNGKNCIEAISQNRKDNSENSINYPSRDVNNNNQHEYDSDGCHSTASLISHIKNPEKRRTSRVEYKPKRQSITKIEISKASNKAKNEASNRKKKKKLKKLPKLPSNPKSIKTHKQKNKARSSQKSKSSKAEYQEVIKNHKSTSSKSKLSNILKGKNNLTSLNSVRQSISDLIENYDLYDAEIEDVMELELSQKGSNCNMCDSSAPEDYSIINGNAYFNKKLFIPNGSYQPGPPDSSQDKRLDFSIDYSDQSNSNIANTGNKRIKSPNLAKLQNSRKKKNKIVKSEIIPDKPQSLEKQSNGIDSKDSRNFDFLSDEMLSDSFPLTNRSSARLKQIQTQKDINSSSFDSPSNFKGISSRAENIGSFNSTFNSNNLQHLILPPTNNISAIPLSTQLSPGHSNIPINDTARYDPVIRSRYENAAEKMRKVEAYFDTCENLYFGKSFNVRNDPSYQGNNALQAASKISPRNPKLTNFINNSIGIVNDPEAYLQPSSHLITKLILSNNISKTEEIKLSPSTAKYKTSQSNYKKSNSANRNTKIKEKYTKLTPIELLTSPLRKPHVLDKWAPIEVCKFEAAICKHGKDFSMIQRLIQTKNIKEIVDFYYLWKKTNRYYNWKKSRTLSETIPANFFE